MRSKRSFRRWFAHVFLRRAIIDLPAQAEEPLNQAQIPEKASSSIADSGLPQEKYSPGTITDQTAQRLARLLISEIRLYKRSEIESTASNVYDKLKDAIDNARRYYEKRLGTALGTMPDYFHAELIRSLCGGDASRLGPNYHVSKS
jgi:hypothetical protein